MSNNLSLSVRKISEVAVYNILIILIIFMHSQIKIEIFGNELRLIDINM